MKKNFLTVVIASSSLLFACQKNSSTSPIEPVQSPLAMSVSSQAEGETILGDPLLNPYTPENMMMALDMIRGQVDLPDNFEIQPTHYYVKYKPQSWEDYVELHEDTSRTYFDYPLDREIVTQGNRYHDPSIADSMPEYQYTTVEINAQLNSNIPYEIISPLYIPELDQRIMGTEAEDKLLDQAYILTENFSDTLGSGTQSRGFGTARRGNTAYRPAGQILINDNRLNQDIGLQGVLVTARRWFTVFKARPDQYGNFQVNGMFKRPCNYSAHYEAFGFNVRQNFFNIIAYINGPKQTGNWNHTVQNGGYNNFAGQVFRGAYYYHYGNIDGLTRPFNPTGKFTTYVAKSGSGNGYGVNWGIIPLIKIWEKKGSYVFRNDDIFSTTIHETTHLTHNIVTGLNTIAYASVRSEIRESWATCVEWHLTGMEYRSRGVTDYGRYDYDPSNAPQFPNHFGYQTWKLADDDKYTSLFINCIDKMNEYEYNFGNNVFGTVNDRVGRFHPGQAESYSIADLEYLVIRWSVNLTTVKDHLKLHKPSGVTDGDIDLLFDYY